MSFKTIVILILFAAGMHGNVAAQSPKTKVLFFEGGKEISVLDEQKKIIQNYTHAREVFDSIGLEGTVNFMVFEQAMYGLSKMKFERKDIITLVDYSLPSTVERMFVIDLANFKLLYSCHVAHGKNTGEKYATKFSNKSGSNQSSLGFYRVANPYDGRNGYSLKLYGLEDGINDMAFVRAIVIHGADYCDPAEIPNNGRLGRSQGCFAVAVELNEELIDTIKGGSMLYAYADYPEYLDNSKIITAHNKAMAAARK